jgi:hypothetical protein
VNVLDEEKLGKYGLPCGYKNVGFEVLAVEVMKSCVTWNITMCSPLKVGQHFGGACRLHLQDHKISQAKKKKTAWLCLLPASHWFLTLLNLWP